MPRWHRTAVHAGRPSGHLDAVDLAPGPTPAALGRPKRGGASVITAATLFADWKTVDAP